MAINSDSVTRYSADATVMEFRGRIFSGHGIETGEVMVDDDGTVRAWDKLAAHYTTCHSISDRNQRAMRRVAKR